MSVIFPLNKLKRDKSLHFLAKKKNKNEEMKKIPSSWLSRFWAGLAFQSKPLPAGTGLYFVLHSQIES